MRKIILPLTVMLLLSACGNKKTQAGDSADSLAVAQDSVAVVEASNEEDQAFDQFFEQLDFDKFVDLLKGPSEETAKKCGLSEIYTCEMEQDEENEAGGSCEVYGWGVEKGKQKEFGYELKETSPHACYFYYQLDTSTQAAMCFKSKADADRFMEKALAYGLVDMNGNYHINDTKLPNGTVKVDSFSGYNILTSMEKPGQDEYHPGFYVIKFYYFA
ncbi:MAG: hypothetical protein IJ633_08150 [Prevotella sp.]|nr:hypothetical protein [Prevotella sp.]